MNIAKYSLDNAKVIYFFLALALLSGVLAFGKLSKKEDAPFVIKQAALVTQFPGASPAEVEKMVTEPIEREIQTMPNVFRIKSESSFGMSKITIELQPFTNPKAMPQMWDELRKKVSNINPRLPSGCSPVVVNDDFGDVFGIYYGLYADEGFSYSEMREMAQTIKTQLNSLELVQKVNLVGEQQEVINVFVSLAKLSNMGIDPNSISQIIQSQNKLIDAGIKQAEDVDIRVYSTGVYQSIDDIKNQLITTNNGEQIRLGDFATVEKGYKEPTSSIVRINGQKAIGIGISSPTDKDVVKAGQAVSEKLEQIKKTMPIGMELISIYPEDVIAAEANNGFLVNLVASVVIVILVLFFFMGGRASLLIGTSLIFAIAGTLAIMIYTGTGLNRTSLAAFIIAMGMLVDNAIVVTDNAQIAIKKGTKRYKALIDGATKPQWGLLGATLIAVFSFLPLYLSANSAAEIVQPLFIVLCISLMLSWVLALVQTTTFGNFLLKENTGQAIDDPYDKKFYHKFEGILETLLMHRWKTIFAVVALFFASLVTMSLLPSDFFPKMDKPYFRADLFLPEGYSIRETQKETEQIEAFLRQQPAVKNVFVSIGGSHARYYLASSSYGSMPNFANILVELHSSDSSKVYEQRFYDYINGRHPNILCRSSLFKLSAATDAAIEICFKGNHADSLAALYAIAKEVVAQIPEATEIRSSWGSKVPILVPHYSQDRGQRVGVTRQAFAQSMTVATTGMRLGEYREKDLVMPILLKDNAGGALLNNLRTVPVFNNKGKSIPIEQVAEDFTIRYEYPVIFRYNRERTIILRCEPLRGENANEVFDKVWNTLNEKIVVPEGYEMFYLGEAKSQEDSNEALAANFPLTMLLMFVVLLILFRDFKKPALILLMLPLIFIGVVLGLVALNKSFDFFAILGLLGLVGMNIKSAIVLVDEINIQIKEGMEPYHALIYATKTRIIPVAMSAGTTILGMLPLLRDAMFGGMAATIMGGLLMATILTVIVLPVAYALMFNIKKSSNA